jgi:hypothetical protein
MPAFAVQNATSPLDVSEPKPPTIVIEPPENESVVVPEVILMCPP